VIIHESAEDYLETILLLKKSLGEVRSVDIANKLNFKKSSISAAMKKFRINGYITVDENGYINLTNKGKKTAEMVYERHKIIRDFLLCLGVSENTAKEDACRIEHIISEESLNKIKEDLKKRR
jgi:Mn-dependent DtxR family transcriptional regulator